MSKLKINDKVIVKESGKTGVVKGRDVVGLPDGKVRVEYIVKTGDGKRQRLAVAKLAYRRVKSRAVQAVELAVERSKIRIFFTRTGQNARKQRICSSAFF